ncbi:hypothetical protein AVEN_124520-1 [Araneus ventricosus]|uniref:Uncharacterized protein n=1 Tax=Araneus ventricosus TaxID=182803 RepID=A0A4Y2X227_ARAVE|nr:hypothetical protein AVEN_124520-1 [Araneus ventricosus]
MILGNFLAGILASSVEERPASALTPLMRASRSFLELHSTATPFLASLRTFLIPTLTLLGLRAFWRVSLTSSEEQFQSLAITNETNLGLLFGATFLLTTPA